MTEGVHSVADFAQEKKKGNVFLGLGLFPFYEGYFYYKYRLCIRVNLEIKGLKQGFRSQQEN